MRNQDNKPPKYGAICREREVEGNHKVSCSYASFVVTVELLHPDSMEKRGSGYWTLQKERDKRINT